MTIRRAIGEPIGRADLARFRRIGEWTSFGISESGCDVQLLQRPCLNT